MQQRKTLSISTQQIEGPRRHEYWVDLVCDHLVRVNCIEVANRSRFFGHIEQQQVGPLSLSRIRSQAQRVRLTPEIIAQASEEYVLVNIQRRGSSVVRQSGREAILGAGDLALYTSDCPYELAFDAGFEQHVLILPAAMVRDRVPDLHRSTATTLPCSHPTATLLRHATEVLFGERDLNSVDVLGHVVSELIVGCASEIVGRKPKRPSLISNMRSIPIEQTFIPLQTDPQQQPTPRERAILELTAKGYSYVEVAERLGVSVNTVRTHVRGLYGKLGADNRTEAVFEAQRVGWLV
jgi:DNA-binding CsgD family transcriptional regulator